MFRKKNSLKADRQMDIVTNRAANAAKRNTLIGGLTNPEIHKSFI